MRTDFPLYLHLARVRLGQDGPEGRLMKCEPRGQKGTGAHFWRIKLDDGRWVRAERFMHAGEGQYVRRCRECELDFPTDTANEVMCPVCERHLDSGTARDPEPNGGALRRIRYREEHRG